MIMTNPVVIAVEPASLAEELGMVPGDQIFLLNGKKVEDLIQFQLEWAGEEVILEIAKADSSHEIYEIEKEYDEPLGVSFDRAVFDGIKACSNKCDFCFVDQMPKGMRDSLYVKDDDYRLSFLQGSFVTLTNLSADELARIKEEHLSPLYVSVHTTDSQLRQKLMKNPQSGKILAIMKDLAQHGIEFHTQVVLCPGLNDGAYLEKTFTDLVQLPNVLSLAVVPVGLTGFRAGLASLRTFQREEARQLVEWVEQKQAQCLKERGTSFIWASDEFYIQAGRELPAYENYEDFPQLENGIGMVRLFWEQFSQAELPSSVSPEREAILVTGVSGQYALEPVVKRLNQISGLQVKLQVVENNFFGASVTVTGLLTGTCLLKGLKHLPKGSTVVIPDVLLEKGEGRFLDNKTVGEIAAALELHIVPAPVDGQEFLELILA